MNAAHKQSLDARMVPDATEVGDLAAAMRDGR
jgi:hypothetical protein